MIAVNGVFASVGEKIGESGLPPTKCTFCSIGANRLLPCLLGEALMAGPPTAESMASPNGLSLHVPGTLADLS